MKHFAARIALPIALCTSIWIGCDSSNPVATEAGLSSQALSKQGDLTGNGGPSGPHYNLNLIATKTKNSNLDGGNGHRIFVKLGSNAEPARTRINLCNSSDPSGDCYDVGFEVLDANGTDGTAEFALPDPCTQDNTDPTVSCDSTWYSVWARALGHPGLWASLQTCAESTDSGEYCSSEIINFESHGNKPPKFGDVSKYLLTLYLDFDVNSNDTEAVGECLTGQDLTQSVSHVTKRVGLFNSCLENFFWYYDNKGLKILQLRFYPFVGSGPFSPAAPASMTQS